MFIDSNKKRINIYAPFTSSDGEYGINLTDPAQRKRFKIKEIPDPVWPEGMNDSNCFRNEIDVAPYVVFTPHSKEMIAANNQIRVNNESEKYLKDTDWYVTRFLETGVAIPEEVKTNRQKARESIIK